MDKKSYYEPEQVENALKFSTFLSHLYEINMGEREYDILTKDVQNLLFDNDTARYAQIATAIAKASKIIYAKNGKNQMTKSYVDIVSIILYRSVYNPLLGHIPTWILETVVELSNDNKEIPIDEFIEHLIQNMLGPCDKLTDRLIDSGTQLRDICKDKISSGIYPIPNYADVKDGYEQFTKRLEILLPKRENKPSRKKDN